MGQDIPEGPGSQRQIWNEAAEQAVLSSMFLDPARAIPIVRALISPDDFFLRQNHIIAQAILAVYSRSDSIDHILVCEDIERNHGLESIGGKETVYNLSNAAVLPVEHVQYHAEIVAEKSYRRRLAAWAMDTFAACHNGDDPAGVVERGRTIKRPGEASGTMCKAILSHPELESAELPKIEPILGKGLLARGDYGVLFGPKGTGKTWLALQLAAAASEGEPFFCWPTVKSTVLIWSLELTRDRLRERLRAISPTRTHPDLFLFGKDSLRGMPGAEGISPIPRLAVQVDQQRVLDVVAKIRPDLMIIDPLGPTVEADENKELMPISRFIVDLSARMHCAVFLTHHPRKAPSSGPAGDDKNVHELRGAGQFGDWASCVMHIKATQGLYRITQGAEPRHCLKPEDVWLERTELGTFRLADGPSHQEEDAGRRRADLLDALQAKGEITSEEARAYTGKSKKTTLQDLRAINAVMDDRGNQTVWKMPSLPGL
jgi:hypothetical protein